MSSPTNHFIQVNDTPKTRGFAPEPAKFTLQWRNLSLKAEVKNAATKKTEETVILNNVSGSAKPGELLVIMGPSGAGKSSLLDCISGRKSGVEGEILLNGQPWTKATKRMASYVMQDDLFYETLTVKEHLTFQNVYQGRIHASCGRSHGGVGPYEVSRHFHRRRVSTWYLWWREEASVLRNGDPNEPFDPLCR